ncbi:MAG: hypothetical protein IJU63_04885 [Bacteroidales bacterium]|nr:hypothetical protein [Bacteroidales bacterium]
MSKELIQKNQIILLPNSYYALYSETNGFFNPKVVFDHCFYIDGKWKGLGFHSPESQTLYTSFVKFLNSGFSKDRSYYRFYVHNSTCITIIKAIHHLVPQKISILKPYPISFYPNLSVEEWIKMSNEGAGIGKLEFGNQLGLMDVGKLNSIRVEKFILNGNYLSFILSNQERVNYEVSEEEYIFIRDFIKMSFLVFLPSMINRICFEINSDTSCIETAIERGWIK